MAVDADSEGHIKVTVKSGQYENEPVRIVKNHYGSVYIYKNQQMTEQPFAGRSLVCMKSRRISL